MALFELKFMEIKVPILGTHIDILIKNVMSNEKNGRNDYQGRINPQ